MNVSQLRAIAICLFTRNDKILVAQYEDRVKQEKFFRPIGGGIEFGEYAAQTIARETHEELGVSVRDVRYLFTLENIFEYQGEPGHEIVLVCDGAFADEALYARAILYGRDTHDEFEAYWRSLNEIRSDTRPLYPSGLLQRLSEMEKNVREALSKD